MGEVVNLRHARKARARSDHATAAAANRALHGRTSAERVAEQTERARAERRLDSALRDD